MILKFIGRGSAFNVKEGNNSAYLKINDELLLIDCGEGIFERIIKNNLLKDIRKINVVITHMHSDHVGSLSSFIYYCYYIKNIIVNVNFPDDEICNFLKMQGNIEGEQYRFKKFQVEKENMAGSVIIIPFKVIHAEQFNNYGYLIKVHNKTIWFSGDSSKVSSVINKYKVDEIYNDTCFNDYEGNIHTSLKKLCESIPVNERHKVYCMHIDCDELVKKAEEHGFNVVSVI